METSVIPNKYLNYGQKSDGDLVVADNFVNVRGRLMSRPGWRWAGADLKPFALDNNTIPINGTVFDGRPFLVFKDYVSGHPRFAYKNNLTSSLTPGTGNRFREGYDINMLGDFGPSPVRPRLNQLAKRLCISSNRGLAVIPSTKNDVLTGAGWRGASPRIAGSASALGLFNPALVNTTATLNQDWLIPGAQVAYRVVWSFYDSNGAYVFGSPSDRLVVRNTDAANRAVQFSILVPGKIVDVMTDPVGLIPTCEIYRTRTQPADDAGNEIDPGDEMYFVSEVRIQTSPSVPSSVSFLDFFTDPTLQDPLYTNELQEGALSARYNIPPHFASNTFKGSLFFGDYYEPRINQFEIGGVRDPGVTVASGNQRGLRTDGTRGDVLILGDIAIEANTVSPNRKQFLLGSTSGFFTQVTRIVESCRSLVSQYNTYAAEAGGRYRLYLDNGPNDFVGKLRLMSIDNDSLDNLSSKDKPYVGLVRQNGWSVANDPSPVSPDPRISDQKGIGYRITSLTAAALGPYTFNTTAVSLDFVAGDTIQIGAFNNNDGDPSITSLMMQFAGKQLVVGTVAGGSFTVINPATGGSWVSVPAVNTATLDPGSATIGVGAVMCTVDNATMRTNQCTPLDNYFPSRIAFTPPSEPESFKMLVDWIAIGDTNKRVLGIGKVDDHVLVFKEDGLFRVIGDYPEFSVVPDDRACILWAPHSIVSSDNACYAICQNGIYRITTTSVEIISGPIDSEIQRIIRTSPLGVPFSVVHGGRDVVEFWVKDPLISGFGTTQEADACNSAFVWNGEGWMKRVEPMSISFSGVVDTYSSSEAQFGFRPFANMLLAERKVATNDQFGDEGFWFRNIETVGGRLRFELEKDTFPFVPEFITFISSKMANSRFQTDVLTSDGYSDIKTGDGFSLLSDTATRFTLETLNTDLDVILSLQISEDYAQPVKDAYNNSTILSNINTQQFYSNINKTCVWFVGEDTISKKRAPLWGVELVQPRFYEAFNYTKSDLTYSDFVSENRFVGYGFGLNGSSALINANLFVPMSNIDLKFIPLSVRQENQEGYAFYFAIRHNTGRDVFVVDSIRVSFAAGTKQLSRKVGSV
jgi:hypothetical protein